MNNENKDLKEKNINSFSPSNKEKKHTDGVRQNSKYSESNKPEPDNNIFFEERSNPLCSKGN